MSEDEELRLSIQRAVLGGTLRIVRDEIQRLGKDVEVSRGVVLAIAEIAERYVVEQLAPDLESFAKHAKRQTVTTDDVKLAARRNRDLLGHLAEYEKNLANDPPEAPPEQRTRTLPEVPLRVTRKPRRPASNNDSNEVVEIVDDDDDDDDAFC